MPSFLLRSIGVVALVFGFQLLTAASDVITLPQVDVTDTRLLPPPEKWRYVAVEDFEILSNANDGDTTRFVADFLLLQQAMHVAWPALAHVRPRAPVALLLCKSGDTFDALLPDEARKSNEHTASVFLSGIDRTLIAVDFAPTGGPTSSEAAETSTDAGDASDVSGPAYSPHREVYRHYFRLLLRNTGKQAPPLWLEDGLIELLSGLDFTKGYVSFGRIGERSNDFNLLLSGNGNRDGMAFMPFAQMFTTEKPSEQYKAVWRPQTCAFVHLGLFGLRQKYRAGFIRFATLACRGPVTEEMFKACFGASFKEMQLTLRTYVQHTSHGYFEKSGAEYKQALKEPAAFEVREATQGEAGRIKGEALAAANRVDAARATFSAACARDRADAALVGAMGLFERKSGSNERAKALLEAAVKAKVPRGELYSELAQINFETAQKNPASTKGKHFSASQVSAILNPLFAARQIHVATAEMYDLIAETWSRSGITPKTENLAVLDEGIREYPNDTALLYATARLYSEIGDTAVTSQLIHLGSKRAAADPTLVAKFEALRVATGSPVSARSSGE